MYCKVHRPVNTPGVSDNKGKCVQLVEYLSKELKEERPYYDIFFFHRKEDYVTPSDRHASYGTNKPQDTENGTTTSSICSPSIPAVRRSSTSLKSDRGKDRVNSRSSPRSSRKKSWLK